MNCIFVLLIMLVSKIVFTQSFLLVLSLLRVLGFAGMVLVLWSPIIVPLLPTLVLSWTTSNPSRFAEFVCIVGLYTAIMILVTLWGRRIRGYEDPLEQYGLDLTALPKVWL